MNKLNVVAFGDFYKKNLSFFLFLCFFVIYLILGVIFSCNSDAVYKWDIIYGLDTLSRFHDFVFPYTRAYYWPEVHPFTFALIPPLITPLKIIGLPLAFTVVLLQSFLGAISVSFLYKSLILISDKKVLNLLLTLIYAFSFSMLIFVSFPENYIYIAFFSVINLYYVLKCRNLEKLSWLNIFILAFLSFLMFSINSICIIYGFVLIIYLLFKTYKTKIKAISISFLKIIVLFCCFILLFSMVYKIIYPRCASFLELFVKKDVVEAKIERHKKTFVRDTYDIFTTLSVVEGVFVKPFYALPSEGTTYETPKLTYNWNFSYDQDKKRYIPALFLFGISLFVFILKMLLYGCFSVFKSAKVVYFKDAVKNIGLITTMFCLIFLHSLFSSFYGVFECFLYALNALLYFIVFIGLCLDKCNEKLFVALTSCFLIFQVITNFKLLTELKEYLHWYSTSEYHFELPIFPILILLILVLGICKLYKAKIKNKVVDYSTDKKYLVCIVIYVMLIIIYGVYELIFKV